MSEELIEALAATIACNSPSCLQYPWHRKAVQAILSELSAAGFVVVPNKPTQEMVDAGAAYVPGSRKESPARRIFEAMLKARRV